MRIEHIAIWTADLDRSRAFYETYFGARAGERYNSRNRPFSSYFLSFVDGARVEIMQAPDVTEAASRPLLGYAHIAISVGSAEGVDALTKRLATDGHRVLSQPRTTGDGYYESTVTDPDGNVVEITA